MNNYRMVCLLVPSLLLAFNANADFVGKNGNESTQYNTVKSILANPVDDRLVTLTGHITEKIRHEKYLFTDGTETIRLDIDDKKFPSVPVDESTTIKIYGDVEKEFLESPEIDVDYVEIVK